MSLYRIIAFTLVLVIATMACMTCAWSQNLIVQALKVFGIAYVVRTYSKDMNKFVNNLAGQRGVKWEGITKVVPIISVGQGAYIGAAQVQGTSGGVSQTRAVGQVETRIGGLRAKLLVPVNTTAIGKSIHRIQGVGVSALLDFKI